MDVGFCRGPARGRVLPDVAAQLGCSMRPPRVVVRSVVASTRRRCYSAKITPELAVPNGHFAQATIAEAVGRLVIRTSTTSANGQNSLSARMMPTSPLSAYCAVAANIPAASAGLWPCIEASTIPARRSRTRSRAVLVILTRRCAWSGSNSRTNTSGLGELRPAVGVVHQRLRVTVTAGCTDLSAQDASAIGYRTGRARVKPGSPCRIDHLTRSQMLTTRTL